jgi:5-(carboxyamino)imidazole ribonucleotide synthase
VLKTAGFGYDGKGQAKVTADTNLDTAWAATDGRESILEAFVDFETEVSVVAARGAGGQFEHFGVVRNDHAHHILDVTSAPAAVSDAVHKEAVDIARTIMEALNVVGVLCVEFFLTRSGRLVVNELAPRPHNSGHFTVDACVTSQFEQQLRAVCGLPLGSTELLRPAAAMANILGDLWTPESAPHWEAALSMPDVKLHLYGKTEARPRRKMGHITAMADSSEAAASRVRAARASLMSPSRQTTAPR